MENGFRTFSIQKPCKYNKSKIVFLSWVDTHTISYLHLYTNIIFTFIYFLNTNSIECITICLILKVIEIHRIW